jgi:hypothetical protein
MNTKRNKNPELSKKMTADMRRMVAELTGYSEVYVSKVLCVTNVRYNAQIVSVCEKLVEAKENAFASVSVSVRRGGDK